MGRLSIGYPLEGAIFPRNIAAPTLRWVDETGGVRRWRVTVAPVGGQPVFAGVTAAGQFRFSPSLWKLLADRARGRDADVRLIVEGVSAAGEGTLSRASVGIRISRDEVDAPIFFRDVPLPFGQAKKNLHTIRWRLGRVDTREAPRVLLEGIRSCANCHSFSRDGSTFGMNVGFGDKKGTYTISRVEKVTRIDDETVIRWSDLHEEDPSYRTAAFLNAISPDGRYVVAGAQDRSTVFTVDNIEFSFVFFFTYQGILAVYDTQTKKFWPLPGADDERFVQTNPAFSPDGKWLVFARSKALSIPEAERDNTLLFRDRKVIERTIRDAGGVRYDLFRMPFNDGQGGEATPIEGGSANGKSNYFPKISPDGRFIVFTQSDQFNLLQPDSKLFIVPVTGGTAREMTCNTPNFNSWHSFSPSGRWLVFSSKANGPYTQLMLTHIDEEGRDSPAILLENFVMHERAANIPEFANIRADDLEQLVYRFAPGEH